MIFIGKSEIVKRELRFGISFSWKILPVIFNKLGIAKKKIPHYHLTIYYGYGRCWIGYNRFKRIIKDQLYELDGVKYPMKEKNE